MSISHTLKSVCGVAALLAAASSLALQAETYTWTGGTNNNWDPTTTGNWSPNGIPGNGDDVVIGSTDATRQIGYYINDKSITLNSLTIEQATNAQNKLNFGNNVVLQVANDVTLSATSPAGSANILVQLNNGSTFAAPNISVETRSVLFASVADGNAVTISGNLSINNWGNLGAYRPNSTGSGTVYITGDLTFDNHGYLGNYNSGGTLASRIYNVGGDVNIQNGSYIQLHLGNQNSTSNDMFVGNGGQFSLGTEGGAQVQLNFIADWANFDYSKDYVIASGFLNYDISDNYILNETGWQNYVSDTSLVDIYLLGDNLILSFDGAPIPEPAVSTLAFLALAGLVAARKRR